MNNSNNKVFITGSNGLIGSEAVDYFDERGWSVYGVDNNMRRELFGSDGDTSWIRDKLQSSVKSMEYHSVDIRDRVAIVELMKAIRPNLIIHCAAQPSHDLASERVFDDFEINAVGTLNLLEATRCFCPESPFIFMSTNKVYGASPNEKSLEELNTRYDYALDSDKNGINENCRIDATLHSLFGVSKTSADLLVQEYGRYFGMPTVCLRCGCLTGFRHSAAELHGFLAYLAKALKEGRKYRIFGYKGKQVRDNLHSYDVCTFFDEFYKNPKVAAVYNLGGGRKNSTSILEAINILESLSEKKLHYEIMEDNRIGDHICYISDLRRIQADYPSWQITRNLDTIFRELLGIS